MRNKSGRKSGKLSLKSKMKPGALQKMIVLVLLQLSVLSLKLVPLSEASINLVDINDHQVQLASPTGHEQQQAATHDYKHNELGGGNNNIQRASVSSDSLQFTAKLEQPIKKVPQAAHSVALRHGNDDNNNNNYDDDGEEISLTPPPPTTRMTANAARLWPKRLKTSEPNGSPVKCNELEPGGGGDSREADLDSLMLNDSPQLPPNPSSPGSRDELAAGKQIDGQQADLVNSLRRYFNLNSTTAGGTAADGGDAMKPSLGEHKEQEEGDANFLSKQLPPLPRPSNLTVLIISWYPPVLKLSWDLKALDKTTDSRRLDFYQGLAATGSAKPTESRRNQSESQTSLSSAGGGADKSPANGDGSGKQDQDGDRSGKFEFDFDLALENVEQNGPDSGADLQSIEAITVATATTTSDRNKEQQADQLDQHHEAASEFLRHLRLLKVRQTLVNRALTCFQVTYNVVNSKFKIIEEYPPYLRSIMLERLLPATEYNLRVTAVYLNGLFKLTSDRVSFISPTDNESRRFRENTYRPIHRYPDEKRTPKIGLAQVRNEELTLVGIALFFWIATICLFFNKWGKIRMLEPYQPAYREQAVVVGPGGVIPVGSGGGQQSAGAGNGYDTDGPPGSPNQAAVVQLERHLSSVSSAHNLCHLLARQSSTVTGASVAAASCALQQHHQHQQTAGATLAAAPHSTGPPTSASLSQQQAQTAGAAATTSGKLGQHRLSSLGAAGLAPADFSGHTKRATLTPAGDGVSGALLRRKSSQMPPALLLRRTGTSELGAYSLFQAKASALAKASLLWPGAAGGTAIGGGAIAGLPLGPASSQKLKQENYKAKFAAGGSTAADLETLRRVGRCLAARRRFMRATGASYSAGQTLTAMSGGATAAAAAANGAGPRDPLERLAAVRATIAPKRLTTSIGDEIRGPEGGKKAGHQSPPPSTTLASGQQPDESVACKGHQQAEGDRFRRRLDPQSSGSLDSAIVEVSGAHTGVDLRRKSMSMAGRQQQQQQQQPNATSPSVYPNTSDQRQKQPPQSPNSARPIRRNQAIDYTNMSPRESIRLKSRSPNQDPLLNNLDNDDDDDGDRRDGGTPRPEPPTSWVRASSADKSRRLYTLSELHKHKRIVQSCSSSTLATVNCSPTTSASRAASLSFEHYEERTGDKQRTGGPTSAGATKQPLMGDLQESEPQVEGPMEEADGGGGAGASGNKEPEWPPTFILLERTASGSERRRTSSIEHTHIMIEPPSPPSPPSPGFQRRLGGASPSGAGSAPAASREQFVVAGETATSRTAGTSGGGSTSNSIRGEEDNDDDDDDLLRRPASSCGSARTPLGTLDRTMLGKRLSKSTSSAANAAAVTLATTTTSDGEDNNYRGTSQQQQQQPPHHRHAGQQPEICLEGPIFGADSRAAASSSLHHHRSHQNQWQDLSDASPSRNKSVSIACSGTGSGSGGTSGSGELAFKRLAETYRASTERRMSRLACAHSRAQLSSLAAAATCNCPHCCLPAADLLCQQFKRRVSSACIAPIPTRLQPGTGDLAGPHQRHQSFCAGEQAASATKTMPTTLEPTATSTSTTGPRESPDDKRRLSGCLPYTPTGQTTIGAAHHRQKSTVADVAVAATGAAGPTSGARKYTAGGRRCCLHCGSSECSSQQQQAVGAMHHLRAIQMRQQQQQHQYLVASADNHQHQHQRSLESGARWASSASSSAGCCCYCASCELARQTTDELLHGHEDCEHQHQRQLANLSLAGRLSSSSRPRISSVFAQSPYDNSPHRDSFAALRLLSQKKSKSAEDIAYLSSLVLQIWTRPRPNPLLQSVSQLQLNAHSSAAADSGGQSSSHKKSRHASRSSTSNISLAGLSARRRQ